MFDSLDEVMDDFNKAYKTPNESFAFEKVESLMLLKVRVIINEREKFLTFKLEKEEMKPEDMNEFLLKMNQDLKAQLQEVEDELSEVKQNIEDLGKEEKEEEDVSKKYQHLKCWQCGRNEPGDMLICQC